MTVTCWLVEIPPKLLLDVNIYKYRNSKYNNILSVEQMSITFSEFNGVTVPTSSQTATISIPPQLLR